MSVFRLLDTMTAYQMVQLVHDCYMDPNCEGDIRFIPQFFGQMGMYIQGELPGEVYIKWKDYLRMER